MIDDIHSAELSTTTTYQRGEPVGSGGVGTVYRGRQDNLDRPVAIKEINEVFNVFAQVQREDIITRFKDIVRQQSSLVHPNIVQIFDVETGVEYPYVVMQFAPKGNLRRLIDMDERPSLSVALQYFMQILAGLNTAHAAGVVHGNIKPENVVLDAAGNAMLSDFGMSRLVESDGARGGQVYVGVGTVAYMAPEQFQNPGAASTKSDIYSLGIMFYEMLTGKVPGRRSPMPSSFFPDIPRKLDDIFDRMSMDDIDDRYDSIDAILSDIYASDDVLALIDNRSGVLFFSDPIAGEASGVDFTPPAPSAASSVGLSESTSSDLDEDSSDAHEIVGFDEFQGDDDPSEPYLVEPSAPALASTETAGDDADAEEADAAESDAAASDVLDKLNKYGAMFDD